MRAGLRDGVRALPHEDTRFPFPSLLHVRAQPEGGPLEAGKRLSQNEATPAPHLGLLVSRRGRDKRLLPKLLLCGSLLRRPELSQTLSSVTGICF